MNALTQKKKILKAQKKLKSTQKNFDKIKKKLNFYSNEQTKKRRQKILQKIINQRNILKNANKKM